MRSLYIASNVISKMKCLRIQYMNISTSDVDVTSKLMTLFLAHSGKFSHSVHMNGTAFCRYDCDPRLK